MRVPYSIELAAYLASSETGVVTRNASNATFVQTKSSTGKLGSESSCGANNELSLIALICTAVASFVVGTCFGGVATARCWHPSADTTTASYRQETTRVVDAQAHVPNSSFQQEMEIFRQNVAFDNGLSLDHSTDMQDTYVQDGPMQNTDGYIYVSDQMADDVMY